MSATLDELRQALRRLAGVPLLAGVAVLTLGPGIGANVAIFSLVNSLLLRPLPLRDAGRLAGLYQTRDGQGYFPLSQPDFADYRAASSAWSGGLASHYPTAPLLYSSGGEPVEVNGSVVSANYFSVLGVEPAHGRLFVAAEDGAPGADAAVVVSHGFWQAHLGGRDSAVGEVVRLNGAAFTVVGVAPAGFNGVLLGIPSDLWLTNAMSAVGYRWCDTRRRDCTWLTLIGRLKPGRTLDSAQAEMTVLSRRLREAHPDADSGHGLRVAPLRGVHPAARQETLRLAALLLAGAGLGVAAACANLASLLLARGLTRRNETAVRLALGASRARVVSRAVSEALLLALAGGAAGLLTAPAFARIVAAAYPSDVPVALPLDLAACGCAGLLAVLSGLLAGLAPGLRCSRPDLALELRRHAVAAAVSAPGRRRLVGSPIVIQMALSFVLLASTGLLARSVAGGGRGAGIEPAGVVEMRLRPRLLGRDARRAQAASREALRRLAALPWVRSASLAVALPPAPLGDPLPVTLPERPSIRPQDGPTVLVARVGPRFFRTFGVPVLRGRELDDRDSAGAPGVAVVNRAAAARLWPRSSPIGRHLTVQGAAYEVVGLVPDIGLRSALLPPEAEIYLPYWQDETLIDARLCVRVAGDARRALPGLLRELRAIDPRMPVTEAEPAVAALDRSLAPARAAARLLGVSALLATCLSAVGLFAALSLIVAQRTREIGIRMALGADRRRVVTAVVRDAAWLLAAALPLGWLATLAAGRLLGHYLYGVGPRDPLTHGAAAALLVLIAAGASWLPARRAARVDPLAAIRHGG